MDDMMYQEFLDWLRRRDTVTIRLEDGAVLATGFRARTAFEEDDRAHRLNRASSLRVYIISLLLLRDQYGSLVDDFFAARSASEL